MSICRKVMKIILTAFIWIIRFKLNDQYTLDERTEINVLGFQNEPRTLISTSLYGAACFLNPGKFYPLLNKSDEAGNE
jgi:hypothetical protein